LLGDGVVPFRLLLPVSAPSTPARASAASSIGDFEGVADAAGCWRARFPAISNESVKLTRCTNRNDSTVIPSAMYQMNEE
jgi:hypothetical protein